MKSEENRVCCVCGGVFSGHFDGKPYCNKHYLRMKNNGTVELLGRKRTSIVQDHGDGNATVTTAKGQIILIDTTDIKAAERYSWCISKTGYAVANIGGKVTKMHRYLLSVSAPQLVVDHINGNPLDNRRSNLRICSAAENGRNLKRKATNTSGYAGIRVTKNNRYNVRITYNGEERHIGNFINLDDAVKARKQAELKYFGAFAPDGR